MQPRLSMSGVILAGGRSTCRRAVIESLARLMSSLFDETLVIANDKKNFAPWDLKDTVVYGDLFKNNGPLAGLYTALAYAKYPRCCVISCDMSMIDGSVLLDLAGSDQEEYDALCLGDDNGCPQPFPGIYSRASRFLIRLLIERREYSMQRYMQVAVVKPVALANKPSLI